MIGNFSHWTSPPHTVLPIWESYSGKTSSYIKYYLTLAKHHLTVAKHNESSTLVSANFPSITITAPPPVMREQIRSVDNGSWGFILGFSKSHCFICVFFYLCICADPIRWVEDLSWDPHNHLLSVIFCIFILFLCIWGIYLTIALFHLLVQKTKVWNPPSGGHTWCGVSHHGTKWSCTYLTFYRLHTVTMKTTQTWRGL